MSIAKRLSALERRCKGAGLLVIRVAGGFAAGTEPKTATAGGHHWRQDTGETEDAFAERVTALATSAHEKILVIGGLPCADTLL